MTALIGAEILKLRTTRAWIGYTLALVAVCAIAAVATVGTAADLELGTAELSHNLLDSSLFAGFVAFLVGIASVTSEWRHGTITRTFLATPKRDRVLFAKCLAIVLVAAVLAALAITVVLAIAAPWMAVEGSSLEIDRGVLGSSCRILLAAALWGALGVGVGATIQSQTAALVVGILWVMVLEGLIQALLGLADLDRLADFLPGLALGAFEGGTEDGLSPWAGGAVGLAWVVAIGALGSWRVARRDVT